MKTPTQIKQEADALEKMKPDVRSTSAFGDDHHAAIDAQIEVLRNNMSEDEIYDAFGDEDADNFAQNVLDEAVHAREWIFGDRQKAPSEEWVELIQ